MRTYISLVFFLIPWMLSAQQEPMYGQYIFNNSIINPAQAGTYAVNRFGLLARNQWLGIDGAPRTETAYANLRLPGSLGLAIGLYQDRLGPEVNLQFQTDLAYRTRISDRFFLSGGIRLVAAHTRLSLSEIPNVDPRNPYFQQDVSSGLMLNAGAGILAFTPKSFFGISIPKIFKNHIGINEPGVADLKRTEAIHLFAYGGTNVDLSGEFMFTPSTLLKFISGAPAQLDLNAVFGYKDILDFGPLLRSNLNSGNNWFDATGFLVGIRFLENWYMGYMYEYPMTDLRHITWQTHEISLRYTWGSPREHRIRSPRYFL